MTAAQYVEEQGGAYRVTGTRVSLDSVVYAFLNGEPAEEIVGSFPTLTLEQVYGAIAYYLAHRAEVDDYLHRGREEFERQRRASRERHPDLYRKLAEARMRLIPST